MRKTLVSLFALVCLLVLLAGCGQSCTGVWQCAYMDTGATVMTAGDMAAAGSEITIDLRSGGTGYMTADGETQRLTWKRSPDKTALLLTMSGEIEVFSLEDGGSALVWTMDNVRITFFKENSDAYAEALAATSYGTDN